MEGGFKVDTRACGRSNVDVNLNFRFIYTKYLFLQVPKKKVKLRRSSSFEVVLSTFFLFDGIIELFLQS